MSLPCAEPIGLTKKSVYELAGNLSEKLRFTPEVDLKLLVRRLDGDIIPQDIFEADESRHGSIEIEADGRFRIYLPDYVSDERNRFTIAHELGHYFLHFVLGGKKGKGLVASRLAYGEDDRAEWEANWFAAAFLMPERSFRKINRVYAGDEVAIARYFKVSVEACRIHKKFFNLATRKSG